jgi:putative aldouronate transport system permease protein
MEDRNFGVRCFQIFNVLLLSAMALLTLLPFVYVFAGSFATSKELAAQSFILIPTEFSLDAYRYIFSTPSLIKSLWVTVNITVIGTLVNLVLTSLFAYPLARRDFRLRGPLTALVLFTMLFNGGMIPTFLTVKALGLLDTYMSLIIPVAISAFNLIILKSFFQSLPEGLEEAAKIDGYNDLRILFQIVLPLSMPALATFALFYAAGHWNNYFTAIMYLNDASKFPIQVLLRQIVILASGGIGDSTQFDTNFVIPKQTVKMAVIVISTVPILLVYPFLQRHFTKGILLGSVKG